MLTTFANLWNLELDTTKVWQRQRNKAQTQRYGGKLGHIDQFIYFFFIKHNIIDPHYDTMYTCQLSSVFC